MDAVLFENTGAGCNGALLEENRGRLVARFLFFLIFNSILLVKMPFKISVGSGVVPVW